MSVVPTLTEFSRPGLQTALSALPHPVGWRMLIKPLVPDEKTGGGLYLPAETVDATKTLTFIGQVIAMGDLCYTHARFHPEGEAEPWCKVGDWIAWGNYSAGTPMAVRAADGSIERYLMLNDDEVIAILDDPRAVRIYL